MFVPLLCPSFERQKQFGLLFLNTFLFIIIYFFDSFPPTPRQTGIRDTSVLKAVDTNLLAPLKSHLKRWTENVEASTGKGGKKNFHIHILSTF